MTTQNFRQFLQSYINEDSPHGDLASDALSKAANWRGTTYQSLRQNLTENNACDEAKQALKELIKIYRES